MVNIMNELAASQHSRVTSLKDRRFRLATVGIFAAIVLLIRIAPSQGAFPKERIRRLATALATRPVARTRFL